MNYSTTLKKVLKNKHYLNALKTLEKSTGESMVIQDIGDSICHGNTKDIECSADRCPIQVQKHNFGWVSHKTIRHDLADLLSNFIELETLKKKILSETLNTYQELNLFLKLPEQLQICQNVEEITFYVLDEIERIVGNHQTSIMLLQKDDNSLKVIRSKNHKECQHTNLHPGEGIAGMALKTGTPYCVNDVMNHSSFVPGKNSTGSLISIPLKIKEKYVGVLNISDQKVDCFQNKDFDLALSIAQLTASAIENMQLHLQLLEKDRLKTNLERYVGPKTTAAYLKQASDEKFGEVVVRPLTFLSIDIRGFSLICQQLEPREIQKRLNSHFTMLTQIIFEAKGTVDKYQSDKLLAFFNAPLDLERHSYHSAQAAISIQKALRNAVDPWVRENIHVGIGISTGKALVGDMGSEFQSEYTALGNCVDKSLHLESQAKGGEILVCTAVHEETINEFDYTKHDYVELKGPSGCNSVYKLNY
jgi:class 3 adenylate cyclase/putative methionine-R-sulfoxide reductase with GAF domain